jgi:hypothetical protein
VADDPSHGMWLDSEAKTLCNSGFFAIGLMTFFWPGIISEKDFFLVHASFQSDSSNHISIFQHQGLRKLAVMAA